MSEGPRGPDEAQYEKPEVEEIEAAGHGPAVTAAGQTPSDLG